MTNHACGAALLCCAVSSGACRSPTCWTSTVPPSSSRCRSRSVRPPHHHMDTPRPKCMHTTGSRIILHPKCLVSYLSSRAIFSTFPSPGFLSQNAPLPFPPLPLTRFSRNCVLPPRSAVTATGVIWSRYSFVITPVNYNLFSVNAAMAVTGGYQLYRRIMYDCLLARFHSYIYRKCLREDAF